MIRHIVLMKCKSSASKEQFSEMWLALEEAAITVPGIIDHKAGENTSEEGLTQGYTHCFIIDFQDKDALNTYAPHPLHRNLQDKMLTVLIEGFKDVLVMDIDF